MNIIKNQFKKINFLQRFLNSLDNLNERRTFVKTALSNIEAGSTLLDAGCGSQQFKEFAEHLVYKGQDFAEYDTDIKSKLGTSDQENTPTGKVLNKSSLDYIGNIWDIDENDNTFDAILCTEVLEHIPYPNETIKELSRLLKLEKKLILTAPSNCLRHMDPYFFYTGFSDRWYETILVENGFRIDHIEPVGDYYRWMSVELWRTMKTSSILSKLMLFPTFIYYYTRKKTKISVDTTCMGYHIIATKIK